MELFEHFNESYVEPTSEFRSCEAQMNAVIDAMKGGEKWALKFFATFGYRSLSFYRETLAEGFQDQCNEFQHEGIYGKYCEATIGTYNQFEAFRDDMSIEKIFHDSLEASHGVLKIGICVPERCPNIEAFQNAVHLIETERFALKSVQCHRSAEEFNGLFNYLLTSILIALVVVSVLSTFYDIRCQKLSKAPIKAFTAFSVHSNLRNLLKINHSSSAINVIDGMKSLCAIWIILGHRHWNFKTFEPTALEKFLQSFKLGFRYAVDTFFVCSAVLVTHSLLRSLKSKKFNIAKIYVNRYLRYLPSVTIIVMIFKSMIPLLLVHGPQSVKLSSTVNRCQTYWWKVLLFTQNYGDLDATCLTYLWYLSADFQLFLLTPIIVYFLHKNSHKTLRYITVIIFLLQNYKFREFKLRNELYFPEYYKNMHYRAGEYFVGILVGWFTFNWRGQHSISRRIVVLGWILSIAFILLHIFCWYEISHPKFSFGKALYQTIWRELWALAICWIFFACHYLKTGGIIRSFLSSPFWQPLSRICLSIYVFHFAYLLTTQVNQKSFTHFDWWWRIHIHVGDVAIVILFSAIFYLLIEAPTAVLTNLMCKKDVEIKPSREN